MPAANAGSAVLSRDELSRIARAGDPWRFLSAAAPVLSQDTDNTELRLGVFRHYAALGLIRPALEIAEQLPNEFRSHPEVAAALATLRAAPSGQVPWSRLRERYRANLDVLIRRFPYLATIDAAWQRARGRLELYQAVDGNYQLSGRNPEGRRVWLPALADHKAEAEALPIPRSPSDLMPGPILFEGLAFGWFFERVARSLRNVFLTYSPALYVVEPNGLALAVVLHLHDWREILADPRVYVFAGEDAGERFRDALLADDQLPIPAHHVRSPAWKPVIALPITARLQEVADRRVAVVETLRDETSRLYEGRDAAWWARRFAEAGPADPLRVLLAVSRHTTYLQYCIRDLARAFEARGVRTFTLTESECHHKPSAITYLRTIRGFRPDLVVVIDHFRREYPGGMPENLPYVGWVQDLLPNLHCREAGESLGPYDFFIAPEPETLVRQYGYPADRGLAWTMATDDRTYGIERLPDDELAPYRCDFCYVSNHSRLPREVHDEVRAQFASDPASAALADRLFDLLNREMDEHPRTACANLGALLARAKEETGLVPADKRLEISLLNYYLFPLAELVFRQRTLEWVADYCDRTGRTLHLYGNGWEKHPRFARYSRGFAANGRILRAIYQASAVNLQIITTGSVHQRLLDGLASGGFFLIRYTPNDMMHEPLRRLFAAMRRYGAVYDREYDAREVPELAAALHEFWALRGLDRVYDRVTLRSATYAPYEHLEANGYRRTAGAVFPQYADVAFGSEPEFRRLADRFLADAEARRRTALAMRAAVVERYSFGSLVDALLGFVRDRFAQSAGGIDAIGCPSS